ncbi:phosphonate C-P lyase system protein PhnH [Paracoccus sp. (in: a-proteobacteria)]|uniref:phosphonate C-P lyase system protein PhnH n=1 Tax=Paracoccus sp. TaxID=267 RepID=UPI0026E09ADC|nr:phosphonate C-P lyase system protein PhnH [Paracoccus sp. (in: a-proteobacteria)]MDO5370511.1 phosphonate C-P lyase system protein PhnH [Paracoccus sp. (in: a-proteobacteria)]
MRPQSLIGGFADAPVESARAFRAILEAMARPGTIHPVEGAASPAPLSPAAGVALLTLADPTTPLFLAGGADCPYVRDWVAFHIGAPFAPAEEAAFALGTWADLQPVARFRIGQADYPDRSATLIVEMDRLEADGPRLTGPGIRDAARLSLPEVAAFQANRALFPLGWDCILTCGDRLAALPRSTRVEAA